MSSTNRGAVRQEHDYYATDPAQVVAFLGQWLADCPEVYDVKTVLDPCAGGNRKPVQWEYKKGEVVTVPPTEMAYPLALRAVLGSDIRIVTNDLRPDSPADMHEDFLSAALPGKIDLIITNPPFGIALEVIQHALKVVRPGGWVAMLLRLNFFGSDKRFEFFKTTPPERAYVHHKRMGFLPGGKTDSVEYVHMVWRQGVIVDSTALRVI